MNKSMIIVIGCGIFFFLLYQFDAIGGGMFFISIVILFVASAIISGNAKTKAIAARGSSLDNKLKDLTDFTVTKKIVGHSNKYIIALDEHREKAVYVANSVRVFSYEDVLGCEIIEDGQTISQKSTGRTIGGALVGGLLAGGSGAIIGGLSGKSTSTQEVSSLNVKIRLKDLNDPSIIIYCFSASELTNVTKKKIKTTDPVYGPIYNATKKEAETLKDIFAIIIDKVDRKYQVDAKANSISDELLKLNDLKEKGILTNIEFEEQKQKILRA